MFDQSSRLFIRTASGFHVSWWIIGLLLSVSAVQFWWFRPSPVALGILVAINLLLLIAWFLLLANDDNFRQGYVQRTSRVDQSTFAELYKLEAQLRNNESLQLADLLRELRNQYDQLSRHLNRRLHLGGYSYGPLLVDAEHIFFAALNNARTLLKRPASHDQSNIALALMERITRAFSKQITLLDQTPLTLDRRQHQQLQRSLREISAEWSR